MSKPTIYRITHLWPNKQPGQGLTAQIEEDQERVWTIEQRFKLGGRGDRYQVILVGSASPPLGGEVVAAPEDSSTVQIKPETDELNALPSRFVSLQDYEALEREAK